MSAKKSIIKPINIDFYAEYAVRNPIFHMTYKHAHKFCEIYYLKQGKCTYLVNKKHYHLKAGDIFIAAPNHAHSTSYSGDEICERMIIFFNIEALENSIKQKYPQMINLFNRSCKIILEQKAKIHIESLLEKILKENNGSMFYGDEMMRLYTTELIFLLLRHGTYYYESDIDKIHYSEDIENALTYITDNYMNTISINSVANYCNLSPTYFSKKFKIVVGKTFKEYLQCLRISKATQMLLTTDDSITKIALQCGFSSSNYFKDSFRKFSGVSPREYRKKYLNKEILKLCL